MITRHKHNIWFRFTIFFLAAPLVLFCPSSLLADPILQIYLEGGTYDFQTDSWVLTPPGSSNGEPFRLWVIGNVAGPGGKGTIKDVRLAAAYEIAAGDITIKMTPTTTGGLKGYTDPSKPAAPDYLQTKKDGSTPLLGDGSPLPAHGIYGPNTAWQEFGLGDFSLTDSPTADFIGSFPTAPSKTTGQINVYEVVVTGFAVHPLRVHFDVYNHLAGANHARFAPFSHDADGDVNIVPEPSSLAMLLVAGVTFLAYRFGKRRKKA